MFVLGDFVIGFAKICDVLLETYKWTIIITALMSWVNQTRITR